MNNGMVDACTGVILVKPMLDTASRTQSVRGGLSVFHDREEEPDEAFARGSEGVEGIERARTSRELCINISCLYRYLHVT